VILLVDNYDSFSYNLYQLIGEFTPDIKVIRNDAVSAAEIEKLAPSHIILSPGPGGPKDAGVCLDIVRQLSGKIPVFGVCLGMQVIFEACGGSVSYAKELVHGKQSRITLNLRSKIFKGLPQSIEAARYHSLSAVRGTMPARLVETASSEDGEIMAVSHRDHETHGVQFHPESVMTPQGRRIVENFLLNC